MPLAADRISRWFRSRRMRRFLAEFRVTSATRILDVGGNPRIWATLAGAVRPQIVFLNMPRAAETDDDRRHLVFGDGCALPFADQSFDIAFSNSVIEHVGGPEAQARFAREILRVGRAYWVQTPNRWFPVEQHLWTPFLHWLPKSWQRALVPRVTVWARITRVGAAEREFYFNHYLNDIRLLTAREVAALFPKARLIRERVCGWTKSLIATGSSSILD
ncbi:MAG TPA: methyltransferase domain-containing protein [Bryobacteraceae bacterium]|jgi:SAM-dependent methyltransferase